MAALIGLQDKIFDMASIALRHSLLSFSIR
jgi:hypothetical protein